MQGAPVWTRPELLRIGALAQVEQLWPNHPHGGPPGQGGCNRNKYCS